MSTRTGRGRLIGREQELTRLQSRLAEAGQGQGGVVLVAGEAGIGKTRLLAAFEDHARGAGWTVLSGRAEESEGMPPYLPFSEAFRAYVRTATPKTLRSQLGAGAADVALIAPDIRRRLRTLSAGPSLSPEHERYRLFESVSDFLLAIARRPGLLLTIDDLHWADAPSLQLLQHIAQRAAQAPLLLAVSSRSAELEASQRLATVLARLTRGGLVETLTVAPLSPADAGLLIAEQAGGAAAPALVDAVYQQTAGNPFYLVELVRHLRAEGRDLGDPGGAPAGWGIPDGVRHVVAGRLARLSPAANRALRAGAVLGEGFDYEVLRLTSGMDDIALMDAIDEVLGAGLLRAADDGFRFSHALVRQTIYDGLSLPRRRQLHARAVEAIEQLHAANLTAYLAPLAVHCRLAGPAADVAKALDYAGQAGEAACAVGAWEEAATHWQAGLALAEAGGLAGERCAALAERLGWLLANTRLPAYSNGTDYLEQALTLYGRLDQREATARLHVHLGHALASGPDGADIPRALAHFHAAEQLLSPLPEGELLAFLHLGVATTALATMQVQSGLAAVEQAVAINDRLGGEQRWETGQWGFDRVLRGWYVLCTGDLVAGCRLMEQVWEIGERRGLWFPAYEAALFRGQTGLMLADPRDAQEWFNQALTLFERQLPPRRRRFLLHGLGVAGALTGNPEARQLLAEAGVRPESTDVWLAVWDGGQHDEAWPSGLDRGNIGSLAVSCLARAERLLGAALQTDAMLGEALDTLVLGGHVLGELWVRLELALLHAEAGRPHEAASQLARCHAIVRAGEDWRGLAGRLALAEAALGAAEGRLRDAAEQFERAIAVFRRYALPADEVEALLGWARMLHRSGRHSAAIAKLDGALEICRRHRSAERLLQRFMAERELIGGARPIRRAQASGQVAPTGRDNLTRREVEILCLIATGRSNREIANELAISVNTAAFHVSNILAKTAVANRTEAAAYAHRHNLTS